MKRFFSRLGAGSRDNFAAFAVAVAAGWGSLFWQAHYHWGSESYYNYGWAVPPLGFFLLWRSWKAIRARGGLSGFHFRGGPLPVLSAVLAFTVLGVFTARLFNEANPFWRVPLWVHGLLLLGFYYALILLWGGKRGLAGFHFPLAFFLIALPWPWRLEQATIQLLTNWVTELTVTSLNLLGHPAMANGNVIQIGETTVGVDEACSGIRSLQSLVMVALFLGEFFNFKISGRLHLLAGVAGMVLLFNGARAATLTLITLKGGTEAFAFWHEPLGHANFILSCVLLFFLAEVLVKQGGEREEAPERPGHAFRGLSWKMAALIGAAFALPEAGVQTYFAVKEASSPAMPSLEVKWPAGGNPRFALESVPRRIGEILQYDFGTQAIARWNNGLEASLYYYGYTGEDRMASVSSYGHSPTVCLTAVGGRLVARKEPLRISLDRFDREMHHYRFAFGQGASSQPVDVFWLVWEPRQMGIGAEELGNLTWKTQWKLVKNGRRNFARQVLLIYFVGEQHASSPVRRRVRELVQRIIVH